MRIKLKPNLSTKLKTRVVLVVATSGMLGAILFFAIFGYFNTGVQHEVKATSTKEILSDNSDPSHGREHSKNQRKAPQPINLLSFTVKAFHQGKVLVNWVTVSEKNNDYFTIARSTDGVNFTFLKNVNSQSNDNNTQYYSLLDDKPFTGLSYYKLSQTDLDGNSVEIKVVKVEIKQSRPVTHITAWPNPFKTQVVVGIPMGMSGNVTIKMMDLNGKVMIEKPVQIDSNQSELHLESLNDLPAGNYILKVFTNDETSEGVKLVKY